MSRRESGYKGDDYRRSVVDRRDDCGGGFSSSSRQKRSRDNDRNRGRSRSPKRHREHDRHEDKRDVVPSSRKRPHDDGAHRHSNNNNKRRSSSLKKEVPVEETHNIAPSSSSAVTPSSSAPTIEQLGQLSEKRLRQSNAVKLPTADDFFVAAEKERYYHNMYRLIVTARQEIQTLENKLRETRKMLEARCAVICPSCAHKFGTEPNRLLPRYLKVLRSTNRVELQFTDMACLKDWLLLNNLDRDAEGVPTCFDRDPTPDVDKLRLADVKSSLRKRTETADRKTNEKKSNKK